MQISVIRGGGQDELWLILFEKTEEDDEEDEEDEEGLGFFFFPFFL